MNKYVCAKQYKNFTQGMVYMAKPVYEQGVYIKAVKYYVVRGRSRGVEDRVGLVDFVKNFKAVGE